jgi:hypothetical protein
MLLLALLAGPTAARLAATGTIRYVDDDRCPATGSGTLYDLASGTLDAGGTVDFSLGSCLSSTAAPPAMDGLPQPAPGAIRYYLVRSRNACGSGTCGSPAQDLLPSCP